MSKIDVPVSEFLYPVSVVLVSCLEKKSKKSNIITIAWCGVVSSNPGSRRSLDLDKSSARL